MRSGAVQIAGVHDTVEAALLVECGVDYVGLPLRLALNPEDCSDAGAAAIVASLPAQVEGVLITYLREPREIAELAGRLGTSWVQLHAPVQPGAIAALRALAPDLRVARSLIVHGADLERLVEEVRRLAPHVDAFLTDTFDPSTGATGATGQVHDWSISRALAAESPLPLVLAGGLNPDNVRRAIEVVRPAAVDSHTGVEGADGRKPRALVSRFIAEARAGFEALRAGAE